MHRQVCWVERLEDGTKREVRVTVLGRGVKWQFKAAGADKWDYTSPPTAADWDSLLARMENRYQRRNVAYADLDRVRRMRQGKQARAR